MRPESPALASSQPSSTLVETVGSAKVGILQTDGRKGERERVGTDRGDGGGGWSEREILRIVSRSLMVTRASLCPSGVDEG